MTATSPGGEASVGYEGTASDGLTQLDSSHALTQTTSAADGHIAATENVTPGRGSGSQFTLAWRRRVAVRRTRSEPDGEWPVAGRHRRPGHVATPEGTDRPVPRQELGWDGGSAGTGGLSCPGRVGHLTLSHGQLDVAGGVPGRRMRSSATSARLTWTTIPSARRGRRCWPVQRG